MSAGLATCLLALGSLTARVPSDTLPAASALTRVDLERWLDGFIPYALDRGEIAGATVVVVKDGVVLLAKGYGLANVVERKPMDPERTVLGVGSVSKLFTWTAVMQMVEQGKLDLDRDINQYLDFRIPEAFGQPITLRQLMTHTAGFAARGFRQYPVPRPLGPHLRATPVPPRLFPPGVVPAYSNYGSMLGGYLVERVSGEPFVDYVERHILAPLAMDHSTFRRPIPAALQPDLGPSYDLASGPPEPPNNEEPAGDPSGHLETTASDMAHFMIAQLGEGRFQDRTILAPATVTQMQTTTFTSVPGGQGTALGFFRLDYNGHRILWHGGDIDGFHAVVNLLTDDRVGFFLDLNSNGASSGVLNAANSVRSTLFHRFMDRYFPAPVGPDEPTLATALEHDQLVAGEYNLSARPAGDYHEALFLLQRFAIGLRIKANPDTTIETPGFLSFEDGRPKRWREVAPFVWRQIDGQARIRLVMRDGKVWGAWPDDLPSIYLMQPVSAVKSAALNVPLFIAAVIVIGLALISWLVEAVVRRARREAAQSDPADQRARSAIRLATGLAAAFLLGWGAVLAADLQSKAGTGGWIRLVQLVGVGFVIATGWAVRHVWPTWRGNRRWLVKAARTLTALALLELVWFSFAFRLLSVGLNY